MDAYPNDYVVHNLPLIWLSGLGTKPTDELPDDLALSGPWERYPFFYEKGVRVSSESSPVTGDVAEQLRVFLLERDATKAPWNPWENADQNWPRVGYKIECVGRVG